MYDRSEVCHWDKNTIWGIIKLYTTNLCTERHKCQIETENEIEIFNFKVKRQHQTTWTSLGTSILLQTLKIKIERLKRKRGRSDSVQWQNPLHQHKIRKPKDNTQTPPKTSITQRLQTNLGRSVGVTSHPTGVVKPVYGYPILNKETKRNNTFQHIPLFLMLHVYPSVFLR